MASSRVEPGQQRQLSGALIAPVALLPLLVACGSGSPPGPETISLPPAAPKAAAPAPASTTPQPPPGFIALPSPQQVVAALPTGRVDPFAALASPTATAAGDATAQAGTELRFTGVIRSAGQSQALVQLGDQSGAVCVGQRGVCSGSGLPALLPAGWSVTSIDVASGRLVLNQGGQRRVFTL